MAHFVSREELEELDQINFQSTLYAIFLDVTDEAKPHQKTANKTKRHFVDWYSAKAFEVVQIDLKYIKVTISKSFYEQIHHIQLY